MADPVARADLGSYQKSALENLHDISNRLHVCTLQSLQSFCDIDIRVFSVQVIQFMNN